MKHIIFFLTLFCSAKCAGQVHFDTTTRNNIIFASYGERGWQDTTTAERYLVFYDSTTSVRIDATGVVSIWGSADTAYTVATNQPSIYTVLLSCIHRTVEYNQKQADEMRRKINYYEQRFGTVEIDDRCATFTPVAKPEPLKPCTTPVKRRKK